MSFKIVWTSKSFEDISNIHYYLSEKLSLETANKIIDEIYESPKTISFLEQFQVDEYRKDCRRIIIRNYKILYHSSEDEIYIVRVFNTFQHPIKSL